MHKVFTIDSCFEEYAASDQLVGADSIQDILDNLDFIYPPFKEDVIREDWMDDEDWNELTEYGKYKEGDIKVTPYFTKEQIDELKKSLNKENNGARIKEIPHLFTDEKYTILNSTGYIE